MGKSAKFDRREYDNYETEWEVHSMTQIARKARKASEKEENSKISKYERRAGRPDKYR